MGVLLWRGFTVDAAMAQCFGNEEDAATKGRQMPVVGNACDGFSLSIVDSPFSTLVLQNITFTPSLPRSRLKSHRLRGSATRSNVIHNVGERIVPLCFLVKAPRQRAISTRECY
jgi:hypothetical protein